MSFACDDIIVMIIKTPHTRIVPQNGNHPRLFFLQFECGSFNEVFKKVIHRFGLIVR